jgi:hypothetical protein
VNARVLLAGIVLTLAGCQNTPPPYAPPMQRQVFDTFRPYRVQRIVNMSETAADPNIVKDILGYTGSWRWTNQNPTVKVRVKSNANLRYIIDYSVADVTMKETGPVTLKFSVNGQELGEEHHLAAGTFHFEKAVPAEWVKPGEDTLVSASIDKVYVAKGDGAKLGFILTRIGLTQ